MAEERDHAAEADERRRRIREGLAAAPVVEVVGVVAPNGAGGGRGEGDRWTLLFSFEAWRAACSGLQTRPLLVSRDVSDEELRVYMRNIRPYAVVRLRARVVDD